MNRASPRDPAELDLDLIRDEILRTRQELGATIEALVARADVKARTRERMDDMRRRVTAGPAGQIAVLLALGVGGVLVIRTLRERFGWSMSIWGRR